MFNLHPAGRGANVIQRAGVILGTALVTFHFCSLIILRATFRQLRREHIDSYTRRWSKQLLRLPRVSLSIHGAPLPDFNDGRRYLLLSTHSSHYDIPATFVSIPGSVRMLAKSELFRIPLFGPAIRAGEFPSIDRRNASQARRDLERARQMMESGIVLWAAPEGTRSQDGQLLPFKKGCFHLALNTNAIIVPIAFRGIHRLQPARTWQLNPGQAVQLHVGEPIDSSAYDVERLAELMTDTRLSMLALLGEENELAPLLEPIPSEAV
ncbi:lysophospholipid acyltransferase family protein [Pseudomonas sp. LRF_L74]|uniref:lysophospholipid acyltransferase family protein n=1 Tax=Pseudomonas sp. LRF_L74 TaxID=3369422 RepID=UPI003F61065D